MKSTLLVYLAISLKVASSVIVKHRMVELRSTHSIYTLLALTTDSRGCITCRFIVEIDMAHSVTTSLTGTAVIEEFSSLSIESTDLFVYHLFLTSLKELF